MKNPASKSFNRSNLKHLLPGFGAVVAICLLTDLAAAAPDDESFFTHLHTEKAMANVTVSPGRSGPVDIAIQLETADETPLTAKSVAVTLSDTRTGRALPTMTATRSGEDGWHVKVSSLTAGKWLLGLDIAISDVDEVNVESPILIK